MNYNNYERNIVERYGVALVGWPDNLLPVRNPSSVGGREVLQPLLDALLTQTCHWIRLTEVQLAKRIEDNGVRQAKGEAVYKPRKKRQVAAIKGAIQGTMMEMGLMTLRTEMKQTVEAMETTETMERLMLSLHSQYQAFSLLLTSNTNTPWRP